MVSFHSYPPSPLTLDHKNNNYIALTIALIDAVHSCRRAPISYVSAPYNTIATSGGLSRRIYRIGGLPLSLPQQHNNNAHHHRTQ